MRDAFGVERGEVSKMEMMPGTYDRKDAGATYDRAKADEWAKSGFRVTARDNANGRSYARVGVHPNVPTRTRRTFKGMPLGQKVKTKLIGRKTVKPDFTKVQYEKGTGSIDESRVYQSRRVFRESK